MRTLTILWLTVIAALVMLASRPTPPLTPAPAMTWQEIQTARAAAARPSFCIWHDFGKCRTT
jgi:hypothetical protein